jgi:hypothetical protein
VAELFWEPEAGAAYDALDAQPARLAEAIELALDQLEADPGQESVRRRTRRTSKGDVIWKIDIRPRAEDWTLLWIEHPTRTGDVLILYLGPSQYE